MAIGRSISMIDARQRVTGAIDYALNTRIPGCLTARLVTSPYPHARVVRVDTTAARRLPGVYAAIAGAGRTDLLGRGHHETRAAPDPVTGQPGASAHWHHGVVAVEVAVDSETGHVDVTRMWAGVFAGTIVNPVLCELQAQGCVLMGLGEALFEGMQYGDGGALVTTSLAEYNIPSFRDAPSEFSAWIVDDPSKMDFHGVGETLVPAAPVAIGCAVANAVGVRLRELPLTPERILRALHERSD